MAKTRKDLVYRALKNLGVLPSGQNPSDEEYDAVNDIADSVVEDLVERDVYFLQDIDAVPENAFLPLGHVLAWAAASEFGMLGDQALAAKSQRAEMDLQIIQSTRPTYQTLEIMPY